MNSPRVREDTDFAITSEQIGRLERSLLTLRESASGSPEVLDAIAAVQYQEILRLRTELDTALGFVEQQSDLMVSLRGDTIGLGVAPASVIAGFLANIRAALQTVTAYLTTGELSGRKRLPQSVTHPSDFQFVGATSGSIKLKLNLPEPQTLFPEYEREPAERGLRLMLQAVEWTASTKGVEELINKVEDERLTRLLLSQVQRVAPSPRGAVLRMEFSGRLVDPVKSYVLSRKSNARIRDAFESASVEPVSVIEVGKLRSVDVDSGIFSLRQRPDDQPDLRCTIPREIMTQAVEFLVEDATVAITGDLEYDKRQRPNSLRVREIYEIGDNDWSVPVNF